jgi:hypothetical protein
MNHLVARAYLVPAIGCLLAISLFSCHNPDEKNMPIQDRVVSEHDYIQAFLAMDTLPTPKRLEQIRLMLKEFDSTEYAGNPYYNYLQGYILQLESKSDSALIYYRNMKTDSLHAKRICYSVQYNERSHHCRFGAHGYRPAHDRER